MEFHVKIDARRPPLEAISDEIEQADPSAVLDIDAAGRKLRIAATIELAELRTLLARAGYPVESDQVRQLPSICCGGCSG